MAALVTTADVNAWLDIKKATITTLETALIEQVQVEVLSRVSKKYSTEAWTSASITPLLVKRVISMIYAGYYYLKIYSTDSESDSDGYGEILLANAEILINNILNGNIVITGDILTPVVAVQMGSLIAPELVDNEPKFSMSTEW